MAALHGSTLSSRAWLVFLALGGILVGGYVVAPTNGIRAVLIVGAYATAVAALVAGMRMHRPSARGPWLAVGAMLALWAAAWVWWQAEILATGVPPATSSLVNLIFIAGYPALAGAFVVATFRREQDRLGVVDAGIIACALAMLAWAVLVHRYLEDDSIPALGQGFQTAYALGDVIVLAAALRLAISTGRRTPAFVLLLVGVLCTLVSDGIWNWSTRLGDYVPGSWADAGWVLFPMLVGAAVLHPSMATLFDPARESPRTLHWNRLVLLGVASLLAPALLLYVDPHEEPARAFPVAGAAVLLALLVLVRMYALFRQTEGLARSLGEHNERLRELDRMKDSFVASVSHELRTPLTSIRGYLELVLEGDAGELNDKQREFLSVVDRNSERLLRLVGDLLFVAQVDAKKISLERERIDLAALVREAAQAAAPAAEAKSVELVVTTERLPEVDGDRARLAQLLDNLLSNAIKFTPAGGRVDLRAFAPNGASVVEVADTGMGIPPDEQPRLFERFYRASAVNDQAIPGTGLGLAITKAIADAHGGAISVASEEGRGTTFRVELPANGSAERSNPETEEVVR